MKTKQKKSSTLTIHPRIKDKKSIFVLQINPTSLKIAKYLHYASKKRKSVQIEEKSIPADLNSEETTRLIKKIFADMDFNNNTLIVSLPRNKITLRFIKVPSGSPGEIEKMVSFQAARLVPYPQEELINGYQIIQTDKNGYTELNLAIVHKDIIERIFSICGEIQKSRVTITVNSAGICALYTTLRPEDQETALLIDIDSDHAELVIIANKKLIFSRPVSVDTSSAGWKNKIIEEINRTQEAYFDETKGIKPNKIFVMGSTQTNKELAQELSHSSGLQAQILSYDEEIDIRPYSSEQQTLLKNSSFCGLIGLTLKPVPESFNLLSEPLKEKNRSIKRAKIRIKNTLFLLGAIFLFGAGTAKNLDNKARYLQLIKTEINKIEEEARIIANLEKRLSVFEKQLKGKPRVIEMMRELYRTVPESMSIQTFRYEEDKEAVLRGNCPDLNLLLEFTSLLGENAAFKEFEVKIRFATRVKTGHSEKIDFEIRCVKK